MAISRAKKEEVVKRVGEIIKNALSVVFVRFHGLSVPGANELRRGLREEGVRYTVAKKTLVKRVLDKENIAGERPAFEGELAIAFSDDPIAPARSIAAFQKKLEGAVEPLGGIFEGRYIDAGEVANLASIPPRDVLYGQFATVVNAPIQGTVTALGGITQSFVSVLHQVAESKQ